MYAVRGDVYDVFMTERQQSKTALVKTAPRLQNAFRRDVALKIFGTFLYRLSKCRFRRSLCTEDVNYQCSSHRQLYDIFNFPDIDRETGTKKLLLNLICSYQPSLVCKIFLDYLTTQTTCIDD